MKIETLNCPNCGAGVASDRPRCEFCKTRLKTKACPACVGLTFEGSRFCGHCGTGLAAALESDAPVAGVCPRCRLALVELTIGENEVAECGKCSGLWVKAQTFEQICADRERQAAVLGFAGTREGAPEPLSKVTYVPCPHCGNLMNRSNFARASGVIIDVCKSHGVWFDADELPRVIDFIRSGGMRIARDRELTEIKDERRRLKDERMRQALVDRRSGVAHTEEDEPGGVLSLFTRLWE